MVARPVPRVGRSTAFIPPWKFDGPKEEDMLLEVYPPRVSGVCCGTVFAAGFVTDVSSQSRQELLSITAFTSCESGPPGSDEGADAKGNEGSAKSPHDGLLLRGLGAFDSDALGHADDVDQASRGEKKAHQSNGHGDVHPEHTLLGILSVGQRPEQDKQQTKGARDQRGRVGAPCCNEAGYAEEDKQDAKDDSELRQDKTLRDLLIPL
jgi:hypothetical protein